MKYLLLFYVMMQSCLLASCSSTEDYASNPELSCSKETVDFSSEVGNQTITVITNVDDWSAKSDQNWCRFSVNGKLLKIEVDESEERLVREAVLTVTANGLTKTVKVRQLGYEAAILIDKQSFEVPAVGGDISFNVTTNVPIKITSPDWVKEKPKGRAVPMITTEYHYTISKTVLDEKRTATLEVTEVLPSDAKDNSVPVRNSVTVVQRGLNEYAGGTGEDIKGDIKLTVVSGNASSQQGGGEIEKSFDGDYSTLYHSNWSNGGSNYFPITLTYNFGKVEDVDYLIYYPRTDGANGRFKNVKIEYSEDGNTYKLIEEKDFQGASTATRVKFKEQVHAKSFRFTVNSGAGDGQGFASCSEMEFYAKNPATFDYSTLFTDVTCSELKPGITEVEINKCEYPFFKNIAYYMFMNKYPREFRIDEFKAYPNPDIQSKTHKTNPYSLLDNPTGISVKANETLIVLVGDTHGKNIGLKVQNLDKPGGDGFGGVTYSLSEGINKLTMSEKGLVYVMYHTSELDDAGAQPIKIHFASGTVNGYYDSQKHAGRWSELLGKATDKYFDALGKYAHLTFETADFKAYANSNGNELVDLYDKFVYSEQQLLGLEKYNKMFRNRMYLNVMYHSYMYATSYHTGYHQGTMSEICNPNKLKTGGCWGPAHEIGHCNQTRPGVLWVGNTEVTNNIMSEYIQTTILNQPSRIQTEDMGQECRNRYSSAWTGIIANQKPHADFSSATGTDDVFCKLVPFWQLELYFGKVLGKTPLQQADKGGFYPQVYEYARTKDYKGLTQGDIQLDFVYSCCKASGMNLLDFFEKWGFLRKINKSIDDYGVQKLEVTEAMAEALRAKVNALNLPKPDVALEYISDNTYELYKTKASITKGTASRSGNKLTMTNWKNVVTYEVKDAEGNLKFICSGETTPSTVQYFTLPFSWQSTFKIYAVSAAGTRVEVTMN